MVLNPEDRYRIPSEIYILLHRWGRNLDGMPRLSYNACAAGFEQYRPKGFREEKSSLDPELYDRLCHRIDTFLTDYEREMLVMAFRHKWKVNKCCREMKLPNQKEYYARFDKMTKRLVGLVDNRELDDIDVIRVKREMEGAA